MTCPPINFYYQLNGEGCTEPCDHGTCGGDDCALFCARMAHDFASCGEIHPTPAAMRKLPGVPNCGGISLVELATAIEGFPGRYKNINLTNPDARVFNRGPWDNFRSTLQDSGKFVIVIWDNSDWLDTCRDNNRRDLAGDLQYKGRHAVAMRLLGQRNGTGNGWTVRTFNPLWDGRIDTGIRQAKGPQYIPLSWIKSAVFADAGIGKVNYVRVGRSTATS